MTVQCGMCVGVHGLPSAEKGRLAGRRVLFLFGIPLPFYGRSHLFVKQFGLSSEATHGNESVGRVESSDTHSLGRILTLV